jgi:predicted flap endonuclease-1-like 5' DNA nuclease
VTEFPDGDGVLALGERAPASEAERLAAALEALEARDRVIAERTRRLWELEGTAARLAAVTAQLQAAREACEALQRAREADAATQASRLAGLQRRLAAQDERPETPSGAVTRLEADLAAERRRNWLLGARLGRGAAADLTSLRASLSAVQERVAALEEELAATRDRAERLAEREREALSRAQDALERRHSELEEKDRLAALLIDRLRAAGGVQEGPDDLKEIVGIGPVIEDLLQGFGITTFEQLAALSGEEMEAVAARLTAFPERIVRDRWREQAAALAAHRIRLGPGLTLR